MSMKIAPGLSLPPDAATQTFAIMAIRGVGKTHTATVFAEELLKIGQPVCIYDPTGAWWGLKSSADGKRPGFPVVIFGGEHADVPLEETAGEVIARTIVERRVPAILDCSLLRKAARVRFMTAFCETLYHLNREPLHLFCDEAHTIAPQNIRAMPEAARCLGAIEDIILQGRRRGLGMTAISQRPAMLNTTIRTQCSVLIAMRIVGPHDRKAISEWVEAHGDPIRAKEMMDSLAHLKIGEGWVWSPGWLEIFKQVKFRDRETYDSSATPSVRSPRQKAAARTDAEGVQLGKAERCLLRAFFWLRDEEATQSKVAFYSGYTAGAGAFNNALGRLRSLGLVAGWQITAAGEAAIPVDIEPKPSGMELREWLRPKLGKAENAVLDVLIEAQGESLTDAEIGQRSGYTPGAGAFNNALGRLRSLEAAVGYARTGGVRAAEVFFE